MSSILFIRTGFYIDDNSDLFVFDDGADRPVSYCCNWSANPLSFQEYNCQVDRICFSNGLFGKHRIVAHGGNGPADFCK